MTVKFDMWQRPCGCCFYAEAQNYNIVVFGRGIQDTVKNARIACAIHFDHGTKVTFQYYANN